MLFVCSVAWFFLLGCQYQCKRLTGKTLLQNDYNVLMGMLNPTHPRSNQEPLVVRNNDGKPKEDLVVVRCFCICKGDAPVGRFSWGVRCAGSCNIKFSLSPRILGFF